MSEKVKKSSYSDRAVAASFMGIGTSIACRDLGPEVIQPLTNLTSYKAAKKGEKQVTTLKIKLEALTVANDQILQTPELAASTAGQSLIKGNSQLSQGYMREVRETEVSQIGPYQALETPYTVGGTALAFALGAAIVWWRSGKREVARLQAESPKP